MIHKNIKRNLNKKMISNMIMIFKNKIGHSKPKHKTSP